MSGFYIGVDGKARKVKGGYIGIDGKARKIKKGYIGVNGVARLCYCDVDPVFTNNTWEEIVAACQAGNVPETWRIGDQKTMNIGGTDYVIDIIGKGHDDYSDGSGKAPLTFQMHDCYETQYTMNTNETNGGGWETTTMRNTNLPTIFELMPTEVKAGIRQVNKRASVGNTSTTIKTTADKLFLLSEIEVFGVVKHSCNGEGSQYEYYAEGNSKIKKRSGAVSYWWQRSPYKGNAVGFCRVYTSGDAGTLSAINNSGVSFAFCF